LLGSLQLAVDVVLVVIKVKAVLAAQVQVVVQLVAAVQLQGVRVMKGVFLPWRVMPVALVINTTQALAVAVAQVALV
jgi:hypothetical protein